MASKIKTLSILAIVLLIGTAHAQDEESNEEVGAARINLADILKPNNQKKPSEQNQDGDVESNEQQAVAQMGTGNAAGGTAGEVGRQQGDGVFFGNIGKVDAKPMTDTGDNDAESTEAGGAAMEAASVAEQNEEEQEGMSEQNESEGTEEPEVGEQNEEVEVDEPDTEEPDTEEPQGGMPVMGGVDPEETPMGTGGNNPFIAINGEQLDTEGETADAPQMVGGDGEGADIGAAGDESGEDAQNGGVGGAQTAGGTTESEEQGAAIGQQGEADVESAELEVSDSSSLTDGTFMGSDKNIEGSDGTDSSSSVVTTSGLEEVPVDTKSPEKADAPDLKVNPLAAKAKQMSDAETTEQPAPTTPLPKEEEGGKTSAGLSDANKTRIAISVSAVGAVVLVGIIALVIGKRTQRRSHVNV